MAVPDFQYFMLPFLNELSDGNEHKLQDIYVSLAEHAELTEQDKNQLLPSGKQKVFHNRIGWAKFYLNKAELLSTVKRGVYKITESGMQLLATHPEKIDKSELEKYQPYIEFLEKTKMLSSQMSAAEVSNQIDGSLDALSPTDQIESSFNIIHSEMCDELLAEVKSTSPIFFETLVVELMQAIGYGGWSKESGKATQYSADGGIDGIINEDPLGLDTIYLQAKRYSENNTVGRPDIQAFSGALDMQKSRKGVFITTSKFSKDALEYVQLIEKKIVLIDGQQLAEMMIKYNLGVSVKDTYQIKTIDTDYFNEDQ